MLDIQGKIDSLPLHEQEALLAMVEEYKKSVSREKAQIDFMKFVTEM